MRIEEFSAENVLPFTLDRMIQIVKRHSRRPDMRMLTGQIVQHAPDQLRAIHLFVRKYVTTIGDILGVETVQSPAVTLEIGGDCDDQAVLVATMAASIGLKPELVLLKTQGVDWDHVYCQVYKGFPSPVACDTTWLYGMERESTEKRVIPIFGEEEPFS